jgi:uncharacterized protein YcbK (DUF882 family)
VKVSAHFDSAEFDQPGRYGQPPAVYPSFWLADATRLPKLVVALEQIRALYNLPVKVLSGYRSPAYNAALYAASNEPPTQSQHSQGRAADIQIPGVDVGKLHADILDLYKTAHLDIGGLGFYPKKNFVHVDVRVGWSHLAQWTDWGG